MDDPKRYGVPAKRVLLVDDDPQVLFVLSASLRRMSEPCTVITAQDGSEAYRLLDTTPFDLLVTDIRLPVLDGITLTSFARARLPELPVVWMTAYGCRQLREEAARLRVFHCLEKPVEVAEFRRIVQQGLVTPPSDISGDPVGLSANPPLEPRRGS